MLEWVAILFSRGSSWRRDRIPVSCIGRGMLYHQGTREEYRYPQRETDTQSTVKVSLHLPHTQNKLEDRDLHQGLSCTLTTLHQRLWTWFFLSIPVFLFVLTHPTLRPLSSLTQWPNSLLGHGFPFSWCRMWSLNCVISWSWSTSKMTDSDILLNGHTVCSCLFLVRESHHHHPLTSGAVHTSTLSPAQLTVPSFRSDVGAPQATSFLQALNSHASAWPSQGRWTDNTHCLSLHQPANAARGKVPSQAHQHRCTPWTTNHTAFLLSAISPCLSDLLILQASKKAFQTFTVSFNLKYIPSLPHRLWFLFLLHNTQTYQTTSLWIWGHQVSTVTYTCWSFPLLLI